MEELYVIETVDAAVERYNKIAEEFSNAEKELWELSHTTLPEAGYTFYYENGMDHKVQRYEVGTNPKTLVEVELEPADPK